MNTIIKVEPKKIFLKIAIPILVLTSSIFTWTGVRHLKEKSTSNLPAPLQLPYFGKKTQKIGDADITLRYHAKYSIDGRVVATYDYSPTSTFNRFVPTDIGLVWGRLTKETDEIEFSNNGDRFLNYTYYKNDWYKKIGKEYGIKTNLSNNHLIPNDENVMLEINKIKNNDFIKLKGFLVDIYIKENNEETQWKTSLMRGDSGAGACEIMLVTSVEFLQ